MRAEAEQRVWVWWLLTSMVGAQTVRVGVRGVRLPPDHGPSLPSAQGGEEGPEGKSPQAHHRKGHARRSFFSKPGRAGKHKKRQ